MHEHHQPGPVGRPANDPGPTATGPDREAAAVARRLSWRRRASVRTTPFRPTRRTLRIGG